MENKIEKYRSKLNELLEKEKNDFDNNLRKKLPSTSGIYRIFRKRSIGNETIYLGMSKNLKNRVDSQHFKGNLGSSTLRKKLSKILPPEEISSFLSEECYVQFIDIKMEELHCYEHFFVSMLCPELND